MRSAWSFVIWAGILASANVVLQNPQLACRDSPKPLFGHHREMRKRRSDHVL